MARKHKSAKSGGHGNVTAKASGKKMSVKKHGAMFSRGARSVR